MIMARLFGFDVVAVNLIIDLTRAFSSAHTGISTKTAQFEFIRDSLEVFAQTSRKAAIQLANASNILAAAIATLATYDEVDSIVAKHVTPNLLRTFALDTVKHCLLSKQCLCAAMSMAIKSVQNTLRNLKNNMPKNPKKVCKWKNNVEKNTNSLDELWSRFKDFSCGKDVPLPVGYAPTP